jgi:hypothetical protein
LKPSVCCFKTSFEANVLAVLPFSIETAVELALGIVTVGAEALTPVAAMVPPARTANLTAIVLRNIFLSESTCPPL